MFYEMYLELAGDLISPPNFKTDKNGNAFVEFYVESCSNTSTDKKMHKFRCFTWDGDIFRQVQRLNLNVGDNVMLKGMFSFGEREKTNIRRDGTMYIYKLNELRLYVKYIKLVATKALQEAMNRNQNIRSVNEEVLTLNKEIAENKPIQLEINDNDDPF